MQWSPELRSALRVSLFALAIATAAVDVHAADSADAVDSADTADKAPPPKTIEQVIVEGHKLEVPLTESFSVSTIDEVTVRDLLPTPSTTVETLLNSQPSIVATSAGPNGVRTKIFFRAFDSGQFSQTFDGISLDDIFNAGFSSQADNAFNNSLDPDNIGGVEVFNGVNNPATNGYNSLGGTVNFLPRQPDTKFGGEFGGSYGSFASVDWHVGLNTGDIGGVKQYFSFRHDSSDGWQQFTPTTSDNAYWALRYAGEGSSEIANYVIWNSTRGSSPNYVPQALGFTYGFPPDVEFEIGHGTNWTEILDMKTQLAPNVTFTNKIFGGAASNERVDFQNPAFAKSATQPYTLDTDAPMGFPFWLNSPAYPQGPTYNPTDYFPSDKLGTDYNGYAYAGWQAGFQPSLTVSIPHNVITVGGNITFGELHSQEAVWGNFNVPHIDGFNDLWDEHDSRLLSSLYIQDQISLLDNKLNILPGVKYLAASTKNTDEVGIFYGLAGSEADDEHFVSPTLGISYVIVDGLAAYAAYGQNIKFPDISAYYNSSTNTANTGPQAGLYVIEPLRVVPEHVNDYEIGLRYQLHNLTAVVDYYLEDFTNTFINVQDPVTGLTFETTGGSSRYQGVELQLNDDLGQVGIADLSGYVHYSHNEAKFTSTFSSAEGNDGTAGQPLAGVPSDLLAIGATYRAVNWQGTLFGQYVGPEFINQAFLGTPTANQLKSYVELDMNASYDIPLQGTGATRKVRLGFQVNNLLDTHYYANAQTTSDFFKNNYIQVEPSSPRAFFGSVTVLF
jgi:outer membrane receptor protein involved in Fe transport